MFITAIDPEYWSYDDIPFYERESYTQPHTLIFIALIIFGVVLLVSAILRLTVVRRLRRTRDRLPDGNAKNYEKNYERYSARIDNWKGWMAFVASVSFLFVCVSLANAGVRMVIAAVEGPLTMNSEGETRPEAFKSWLSDEYDIDVSESIAYRLDSPNLASVMVEYQNESVVVKLVEDSANEGSFLLVREDSLEPLEPIKD